jgi:hypothetical protein
LPGYADYELLSEVGQAIDLALYEWTTEVAQMLEHVWQARAVLDDLWANEGDG